MQITLYQSNTTNFIIILQFFGQHVSTPIESSSGPSRIRSKIKCCAKVYLNKQCIAKKVICKFAAHFILDLILEGPEDDSIGVEKCCPKNSNIIINFVVFD